MAHQTFNLDIGRGIPEALISAARDVTPVKGFTHAFYRYPARFSPLFVRAAIKAFTKPGDWVIDPFAGGGTTLVEAMTLGRNAMGIDVSSLSSFICDAKTQILSDREIVAFRRWMDGIPETINIHAPGRRFEGYADTGYYRNLEGFEFWRLRKAVEQSLMSVERLRLQGAATLARCAVLNTAQWALDSRKTRPNIGRFRAGLAKRAGAMLNAATEFRGHISDLSSESSPQAICLHRGVAGAEYDVRLKGKIPPKLILTSPPYPGVHVLYHRWQVDGRRETPAPFWIAGKLDGAGSSYYTMGPRKNPGLKSYFNQLESAFRSIAAMAGSDTMIVQVVAFSDTKWQLPKYLEVMETCGLAEVMPQGITRGDGRLWRDVPNRKWHAELQNKRDGSREVVLFHRVA